MFCYAEVFNQDIGGLRRPFCFWTWLRERHRRNRTFVTYALSTQLPFDEDIMRVTSTPSPRQSELRKIPTSTPSPRSRPAQETGASTTPRPSTACSTAPRPSTRTSAGARSRPWTGVSHLPVPVERLWFAVSFVSLPLFVLCRGDFAPAPVARSLRPSHPLGTPRTPSARLTASRARAGGVLRGVRAEDPGRSERASREDAGADARPGGASLQRRPLRRAEVPKSRFCQQPDPTQPDIDACDDCKCITRKDSRARTSAGGCFVVFFFFLGVLGLG